MPKQKISINIGQDLLVRPQNTYHVLTASGKIQNEKFLIDLNFCLRLCGMMKRKRCTGDSSIEKIAFGKSETDLAETTAIH